MSTSRQVTVSCSPRCSRVTARLPTIAKPDHAVPIGCRQSTCGGSFCQSRASAGPSLITPLRSGPRYCGKSGRPLSAGAARGSAGGGVGAAWLLQRSSKMGTKSPVTPRHPKAALNAPPSASTRAKSVRRIRHGARENNSHQIVSISSAITITTNTATLRIWKSTDDHSRATPMAIALRPRITIAGHQRIRGRVEELFIGSALPTQSPGRRAPNQEPPISYGLLDHFHTTNSPRVATRTISLCRKGSP